MLICLMNVRCVYCEAKFVFLIIIYMKVRRIRFRVLFRDVLDLRFGQFHIIERKGIIHITDFESLEYTLLPMIIFYNCSCIDVF